ncbi:hypothetical protein D3876_10545 [Sphingomonas cavernae]|uniref:Uncharacterized protein n=1 Tax=Sphingomonas cavernae TaxID=2320861 RepID=A0A418WKT0_9SPHN|nr:hypothetical protein D3876_10545 [Sphingomonas cavernae]
MDPRTTKALAEITDEGRFEQLALAVLHHAEPFCAALSQQGVNAAGKTRASPVDNIGFVRDAEPPHMVIAHHTTAAERDLRAKWLTQSNGEKKARLGDIAKTAEIVAHERRRTPSLATTLFLTTNREPDEQLVRDAVALGAAFGITVEIWSRVRLARVLDTDPTGQWIRRTLLGIEQELLSPDLLADLSRASFATLVPSGSSRTWIGRELDRQLVQSRQPISFVLGESGSGKTVACLRAMNHWIAGGGFALIIAEDVVEEAASLSGAVMTSLRRLHPSLAESSSAMSLASAARPVLLLIEDINHAVNPSRAIEKVARWAGEATGEENRGSPTWRILCPVWPRVMNGLSEQARRLVEPMLVQPKPFTPEDGIAALEAKAKAVDHPISTAASYALSTALGHDPLLIGLHAFGATSTPDAVISDFVERSLRRCESRTGIPAGELHVALLQMTQQMLQRRRLAPSWNDVTGWSTISPSLHALRQLVAHGEVVRLEGSSARQKVGFRHDRVRDHLLVEAAAALLDADALGDDIVGDPFFAAVFGDLVLSHVGADAFLKRVCRKNPLAIFHALRRAEYGSPARSKLLAVAEQWLAAESNRGYDQRSLRGEIAAVLMEAEGPDIVVLAKALPESTAHSRMARLRNGDLDAGIEDCLKPQFYRAQWRERQIEHAKLRHADTLVVQLASRLQDRAIEGSIREALLNLAGSVADPRLSPAISTSWAADDDRGERLDDYLWAFAFCCISQDAESVLGPVCSAWAALPQTRNGSKPSPRDELAGSGIRWKFERRPPGPAIDYLVERGAHADLSWQIYYLLHAVDHPAAIRFCIRAMAQARERSEQSYFFNFRNGQDHWQRYRDEYGIHMSTDSRALLRTYWQNTAADPHERIAAFDLWASSWGEDDLGHLREWQSDVLLCDRILRHRLERGDTTAIPQLLPKLSSDQRRYWWQFTRTTWSEDLTIALQRALDERSAQIAAEPNLVFDIDHSLFNALIRLPRDTAEAMLLQHWEAVSDSSQFVQAALYVASPLLLERAAQAIAVAPEPAKVLEFLTMHFGIKQQGHPGLTRPEQIMGLEPYFDLIEEKDLDWLAEGCNEVGWFELRRRLFDPRLPDSRNCWNEARLPRLFDRLTADMHFVSHEIEAVLEAGVAWETIATALREWVTQAPSEDALRLAGEILQEHSRRVDLDIMSAWCGQENEATRAVIANTVFAVRHRTAD